MRDEQFIRGEVPMTKSEVRAIVISKLELKAASVLYDIGAGTGSVSVEASGQLLQGRIYAVEKNPEALKLLEKNREKFQVNNMTMVTGEAPEAFMSLPAPTHAFLGGTGGRTKEILEALMQKNPRVRVVINVIALENLARTLEAVASIGREPEVILVQISRAQKKGGCHLLRGLNPIYILSFGGEAGAADVT